MVIQLFFVIFNTLFNYFFPLYRPLYFFYKSRSELPQIKLLKKWVKPGMVIADVGANVGFYTEVFSTLVTPSGKVYAFEPEEKNFFFLKKTTKKLKNVKVINKAVSDKNKTIPLYISLSLNVDHQTFDSGEGRSFLPVQAVSLDNFFRKDTPNIIKIDVQGYDYFVAKGMKKTIRKSKKLLILGEFWPYGLKRAGIHPPDYLNLLKKMGLEIYFFEKHGKYKKELEKNKYYYCDFYAMKGKFF